MKPTNPTRELRVWIDIFSLTTNWIGGIGVMPISILDVLNPKKSLPNPLLPSYQKSVGPSLPCHVHRDSSYFKLLDNEHFIYKLSFDFV